MGNQKKEDKLSLVEDHKIAMRRGKTIFYLKCAVVALSLTLMMSGALLVVVFATPLKEQLCKQYGITCFASSNFDVIDDSSLLDGTTPTSQSAQCASPPPEEKRFDCLPESHAAPTIACQSKGCCWAPAKTPGAPYCFFPSNYSHYRSISQANTKLGETLHLNYTGNRPFWPNTSMQLQVDINYETSSRLHFQIFDPKAKRYRVPIETPKSDFQSLKTDYDVQVQSNPFAMVVKRRWTNKILFNSSVAPLIFADQFIQISTSVWSQHIYGLGEHRWAFAWNTSAFQTLAFWARDVPPSVGNNLYGSHPFFLGLDDDGSAYGIFLLNSNAMEVVIQPAPALTYRTIGGILDFYIFTGPSPEMVVQQYLEVIGYSALPPYWSLGFHLCRWGYGGSDGMKKVIKRMRDAEIPYDTQWNDIDYMNKHLDWTYDPDKYKDLPEIVQDLHDAGQHYVMIVDPGISKTQPSGSYPPYDDGLKQGVFITDGKDQQPLVGQVWPGYTVYPDFFNPKTQDYWYQCAKRFHDKVPFDGLWTDMNEPSNFVVGSKDGCQMDSRLNTPPYTPKILDWTPEAGGLSSKTICPSAKQYLSSHYNLHSLYGHSEAIVTRKALEKIRNKRPLVITRSSFPSTGKYVGHWTGDNNADWENLYWSIPGMLNFQLFGIPLVGADICGFGGDTTEELCIRWMQLGAFYPFMRNHNTLGSVDQDPAVFSKYAQSAMKKVLAVRYTLLPYLYSLFVRSHLDGATVARPLFFNYPTDPKTHTIDRQFMWGDGLMVSPVLDKGVVDVTIYFPDGVWYDYYTGEPFNSIGGEAYDLEAPLYLINAHIRAGIIIPTQPPKNTTVYQRVQPFGLIVALKAGKASGELFWDDGDSLNTTENGKYSQFGFSAENSTITSKIIKLGYVPTTGITLGDVRVFGILGLPTKVYANGHPVPATDFTYVSQVLTVKRLSLDMTKSINIHWE